MHKPAILLLALFVSSIEGAEIFKYVSLTGSTGTYLEGYNARGIEPRRPKSTSRVWLSFTPSFSFYGLLLGLKCDFYLTNEQKFVTQPINRYSLNPSWSWGTVYLGDFSPSFTNFTMGGIPLRGYGVDLHPGQFRFFIINGVAQEASEDSLERAYKRDLLGVKLQMAGVSLNVVKAKDDKRSLQDAGDIMPQENLVLSLSTDFSIHKLKLEGEVGASAHTRDIRSPSYDETEIPAFVKQIFTPRHSTRFDYAYRIGTGIPLPFGQFKLSWCYVGPGFTSLGLPQTSNDRNEWKIDVRIKPHRVVSVRANFGENRDNLIGEKLATTKKRNTLFQVNLTPGRVFMLSGNYQRNAIQKNTESDTMSFDNLTENFGILQSFNFELKGTSNTLQMNLTYQQGKNRNPSVNTPETRTLTYNINHSTRFKFPLSLNLGLFGTDFSVDEEKTKSWSGSGGVSYEFFGGTLPSFFNVSYTPGERSDNINLNLKSSIKITKKDIINIGIRSNVSTGGGDYTESTANINYSRSF